MIHQGHAGLWSCLLVLLLAGCSGDSGPQLGQVTGLITLDGKPVPKATIKFIPQGEATMKSGSLSIGITDAEGKYDLYYATDKKGAVVGQHMIQITTQQQAGEDEDGKRTPAVKESIPATYNTQAATNPEMKRDVKAGPNEINFELKGAGKVIQAAPSE